MAVPHLLIIDDEPDLRAVLKMLLEEFEGWKVDLAASGPEGQAMARTSPPDLVLLDVMMPDTDGPQTLHLFRSDPATCDLPVVFMTAKAQPSELERLSSLGVHAVICKPFDPDRLAPDLLAILVSLREASGREPGCL